ncbi:MAG: tRNA (adenosine(37)-N6)-threonylcarbamoyltransferase complex ATPase subunit type 1 TsaE [Bacteroidetes bacterium]|nr:tRNA (adenosine(37)-N6)-threonylcarbamoyltransferase complex ATPase subunit type 1 TsaE [Bacteroidota bacterium]
MEISYSLNELNTIATTILQTFPATRCFALYADMGSGKTTLIKELCKCLGVVDNVSSPTFSIINEYQIQGTQQKVFHMDWYRLKNVHDAIEAGVQDILLEPNTYCFIEWPEIAEELLPPNTVKLKIKNDGTYLRTISNGLVS